MTVDSVDEDNGKVTIYRLLSNRNREDWEVGVDEITSDLSYEPQDMGTGEEGHGSGDRPDSPLSGLSPVNTAPVGISPTEEPAEDEAGGEGEKVSLLDELKNTQVGEEEAPD